MIRHTGRTARYLARWLTGRGRVVEQEAAMARDGVTVPATLLLPPGRRAPMPSWIVLHGMTRRGRHHEQLDRFVGALAASGAVVVVPEVPEWIRLELSPDVTVPTIRGALDLLKDVPEAAPARTAVVGFSFGSPQAVLATADPRVGGELAAAVGFGGYCDLERTVRFQFTGLHEWAGERRHLPPDPYGRWIIGANFLTEARGFEGSRGVADAVGFLAEEAGDRQIPARHPALRVRAAELRERLAPADRELFDLFAPPDGEDAPPEAVEELVVALSAAGRAAGPLMDPSGSLATVRHPVHLLHGRGDPVIPYTESLRLAAQLSPDRPVRCTVTRLFAHSSGEPLPSPVRLLGELSSFLGALDGILGAPDD